MFVQKCTRVEALNRGEQMIMGRRLASANQEASERSVTQDLAKGRHGLGQQLLAVGQEQQPRAQAVLSDAPLVVEGGDDRLAGAGGRDHQVAGAAVQLAFGLELVEYF